MSRQGRPMSALVRAPPRPRQRRTGTSARFANLPLTVTQRRQVKQIVQYGREKHQKIVLHNATVDSVGTLGHLSPVTQGDAFNQRDGDVILPYKIKLRLSCQAADSTNKIRFVIFKWNTDDAPTIADLIDTSSIASPNVDFRREFYEEGMGVIIYDKVYNLTTSGSNQQQIDNRTIKLKGKCMFTGALSTNYGRGNLWYLALSNSGAVSHPNLVFESKLMYTDA